MAADISICRSHDFWPPHFCMTSIISLRVRLCMHTTKSAKYVCLSCVRLPTPVFLLLQQLFLDVGLLTGAQCLGVL